MAKAKTKAEIQAELEVATADLARYREAAAAPKLCGVIAQLRVAFTASWLATFVGAILGAFVPVAVYFTVHHDLADGQLWKPATVLVAGGLAFSAKTVFQWTREAFACSWKAAGFTVLVEGVLTFSHVPALGYAALALLAVVNAAATASTLVSVNNQG